MSKIFYNGIEFGVSEGENGMLAQDLTKAEYDALTAEEKNNGTFYCITDVNSIQRAEGVGF